MQDLYWEKVHIFYIFDYFVFQFEIFETKM